MKLKKPSFDKVSIITISMIFFAIAGLIVLYISNIGNEILETTRLGVEETGVQMASEIQRSIKESEDNLELLSEYAAGSEINFDNAVEFLNEQSKVSDFENIYYINLDGKGISSENIVYDFSLNKTYQKTLENDFFIEEPHLSKISGDIVFDVAVPVVSDDGEITGVLLSEVLINDLYEILDSAATSGWVFLVDYDLNILFTTSVGHSDYSFIPYEDMKTMGLKNSENALENAMNGVNGSFSYTAVYDDVKTPKILVYSPIENTQWILAMSLEEDVVNVAFGTAINEITYISIIVLIITAIFVCYIWVYRVYSLRSLEKTAYYDPLTKLPNLTKLKKDMEEILTNNMDKSYAVVKIDIENFKAINEMFGFEVGNRVLQAFKSIRETVNEDSLVISRTGVDEFILFSGNGFLDDMETRTELYESYYTTLIPELGKYQISFKYGRYHIPKGEVNVDDIINKLNLAHRISKENKGVKIYDYDESYTKKILEEAELTSKMNDALLNNEFEIYLQPKFSLRTDTLIGAEALVRWKEESGNMIYPNSFIPLFEKNGFIVDLDKYILDNVCLLIKKWFAEGLKPISVAVNCSRLNLNDKNFVQTITKIVDEHQIPHNLIEIELTETTTIENESSVDKLFYDLRANGFKISIDDFGAGYSSLSLLKNLKVDTLKMDRSFFTGKEEAVRGEYVVEGFVKVAHNLDMYVVAEGIETEEQIQTLKRINCDAVQGYYYARPMPISDFEEKYKNHMQ